MTLEGNRNAYRLHDQLSPHQTFGAVLQEFLDGVLALVPGHGSGLTDGAKHKESRKNFRRSEEVQTRDKTLL